MRVRIEVGVGVRVRVRIRVSYPNPNPCLRRVVARQDNVRPPARADGGLGVRVFELAQPVGERPPGEDDALGLDWGKDWS